MTDEELVLLFAKRILFQTPWPVRMVEPPKPIIVAVAGERPPDVVPRCAPTSATLH
jgi:hypothetical protein